MDAPQHSRHWYLQRPCALQRGADRRRFLEGVIVDDEGAGVEDEGAGVEDESTDVSWEGVVALETSAEAGTVSMVIFLVEWLWICLRPIYHTFFLAANRIIFRL